MHHTHTLLNTFSTSSYTHSLMQLQCNFLRILWWYMWLLPRPSAGFHKGFWHSASCNWTCSKIFHIIIFHHKSIESYFIWHTHTHVEVWLSLKLGQGQCKTIIYGLWPNFTKKERLLHFDIFLYMYLFQI